ncbi:hypothetical protein ABZU76_07260 [Amycolatopsis sp. NPDC005232]|uniref:hypothetical protein n=1 Tax=Amycolatopsis sp. NPDC005232 TaxID=3157027 RepID=UPI0033A29D1A
MHTWEPDPTVPAERLPLFGDLTSAARRAEGRQLALAIALVVVAAVLVAGGTTAVAEAVLLGYLFVGSAVLRGLAVVRYRRVKPLLGKAFEQAEVRDVVAGREVGVQLADGRWVRFRASRYAAEVLARRRHLWLLRDGDRAAVLAADAGLVPARVRDERPGGSREVVPAQPTTTPDAEPLRALRKRRDWIEAAAVAGLSALYVVAWLTFSQGDRLFSPLTVVLAAITVLSTALAVVVCLRPSRAAEWTELELVAEPTIAFTLGRLNIEGCAVGPDGTAVAFRVPRASLAAALDIAATGKLWITGSRAGLPGHVWTGTVRFQDPVGPRPDHDHA